MVDDRPLVIAAVGDIQLHGSYQEAARNGQAGGLFSELKVLLSGADIGIGDMETVLSLIGSPRRDKLCLDSEPIYAALLHEAGINLVTLANNHLLDYGPEGLTDTLGHLKAAGIEALGAGLDLESAARPLILERNGIRLGVLAACHLSTKPNIATAAGEPGVAPLDPELLLPAIAALRPQVDHVILLLHWGLEYSHIPTPDQVAFAHAAIDQGASLILGDHSHAFQGIEHHGDGIIAYSLGNLTDAPVDWQGTKYHYQCEVLEVDRESLLLRFAVTRERITLTETVPLWLDEAGRPTAATGERAQKMLAALAEYSAKLKDADLQAFWEDRVIAKRVSGPFLRWWHQGSLWDKVRGFRPGQLVTLYLLAHTYIKVKFSRSQLKWMLFNPRNDGKPMPYVDPSDEEH